MLAVVATIVSVPIIFIEVRKFIRLRKIYNFNKELRKIKMTNKPIKLLPGEATLIGTTPSGKPIYVPDNAKHAFICGTTGSGKTIALSNFVHNAIEKDYPLLIVDGKGDFGDNSLLDITRQFAKQKFNKSLYVINLNDPEHSAKYNPFQNTSPTTVKDMLINMTEWSEEHYKLNTERYLQRVVTLLSKLDVKLSFNSIVKAMQTEKFMSLSKELLQREIIAKGQHQDNIELAKASGKIAESAVARFATIAESEVGQIFDKSGIDIYTAMKERAVILFILNPLLYPEISPAFGRLKMIDSKKAVNKLFGDNQRKFFIYDEISSYASNSLLDLVNKSRSANVTCVLATQSLSDLDAISEHFKEQVIENCNNYLVLRQNSSTNAEQWAGILGTRGTMEVTYQLQQKGFDTSETGFGSARRVREFLYHPDEIKVLQTGKGIYMSKDNHFHSKVVVNKPF